MAVACRAGGYLHLSFMAVAVPVPLDSDFTFAERMLVVMNLFDAGLTAMHLHAGTATEANPLMAAAWALHPAAFLLSKMLLVFGALAILRMGKNLPLARAGLAGAILAYGAVMVWHLVNLE